MPPTSVPDLLTGPPRRWLVTGGAGFIGSHLVETLLALHQHVVVLDNLTSGHKATLDGLLTQAGAQAAACFRLVQGDIRDAAACREAVAGCDHVLHHAALGSVPGSIADPAHAHQVNSGGFLEILLAARDAGVRSLVYASSSAVYGDDAAPDKREPQVGRLLSPYAASKRSNELFAETFGACYGLRCIGLRYFNVYGARQDPDGPYAAVIPRWLMQLATGGDVLINGDGLTTRDFCCVKDVVQANLRAALAGEGLPRGAADETVGETVAAAAVPGEAVGQVFNVGSGQRTTLLHLLAALRHALAQAGVASRSRVIHGPLRAGDIRHSLADIARARAVLGFAPGYDLDRGLALAMPHYLHAARLTPLTPLANA